MITATDLTLEHLREANEDLRMEDRMEWSAVSGVPFIAWCNAVWPFEYGRVCLDEEGAVLCFWGVEGSKAARGVGNVWLAATNRAVPRAREIHRHLRKELGAILERYPELQCRADARNTKHHEWLRWLGFKEYGERPFGVLGLPFKYFHRGEE